MIPPDIPVRHPRGVKFFIALGLGAALLHLTACGARPYVNVPLDNTPVGREQYLARYAAGQRAPELLVLLALSGGGTRAAALAYGVLQELADTRILTSVGERRLLDEVDVISSVSGGSFVSAYYGLYGERTFIDFEDRFLRRPVQTDLAKGMLNPLNWASEASPYYGRSDMAVNYYDKHIFDGRTFGDIYRANGPLIIINSTDLGTGSRFSFVHAMFDLLCTDLDSFPVSRAVMASAAVPGAATPITVKNYAGQCEHNAPHWLSRALQEPDASLRRNRAQYLDSYSDADRKPWIQLADGGISDNLGLRAFYSMFQLREAPRTVFEAVGHPDVRRILIISVNASVYKPPNWSVQAKLPLLAQVLNVAMKIQQDRSTADTIQVVRSAYREWLERVQKQGEPIDFAFAEISFAAFEDPEERAYFNDLPTSLELEDEQVDRLIAAGRRLLWTSTEFQRFLSLSEAESAP